MGSQRGIVVVYFIITWSLVVLLDGSTVEGIGQRLPREYHRHGCFKKENVTSSWSPTLLLGGVGKVENSAAEIKRCAKAAWKSGSEAFGLQENAECFGWRSTNMVQFSIPANNCKDGLGKNNSYFIYIFNKFMKTTSTPSAPRKPGTRTILHDANTQRTLAPPATLPKSTLPKTTSGRSTAIRRTTTLRPTAPQTVKSRTANRKPTPLTTAAQTTTQAHKKRMCIKETTGKQSIQGFFTWDSAKISDSKTSECPLGPSGRYATRTCGGNFNTGAVWNDPDYDNCNYKSKKTEKLNKLSKINLNSRNAKEVAENFTKLFKSGSAKDMSEADANIAADMVDNILSVEDQLNETADMVVEVIDVVMEMMKLILARSSMASTRFIMALERLNQKIPFEDGSTSRVINSTNVAIQAIEVTRSTFQGITFGKGNDNDDGIFVKLPRTILENSIQSSIRIGFIYYANNKLFQPSPQEADGEPLLISNEVISSSVYNESVQNLTKPVRMTFPILKDSDGNPGTPTNCVFWDVAREYWW